jgi:DNA-binding GntR family transcriptional regulator
MVNEKRRANGEEDSALGDVVYRRLREDIVLGRISPRELLVEADLAEQLKVSRTPVREALLRLSSEGLIDSRRRRWMVHQHTPEEIKEIYEVRAALESHAARLSCIRATEDQLQELEALVNSRPLGLAQGDDGMVEANERFHNLIVAACHNRYLTDLVHRNRRYYFNLQIATSYDENAIARSQGQHIALLAAVRDRNPDEAARLAREHVEGALQFIERRQHPPIGELRPLR